ncbi:MAG: DnaD domain protein, partial [Clostridia bacterium]|nr:DnaD domain protein [Clostridia bacterium]
MELNTKDSDNIILPEKCLDMLDVADATDLKVLIYIASLENDFSAEDAAEFLQITPDEVSASVKFWRGAGVLKGGATKAKRKTVTEKRIMRLTTDEVSSLGEKDREYRLFIDVAQQTAGWIFNTSELEIVASLYANLKLSPEYILSLIGYFICKKEQNLRYLEKCAYSFVDEGITTPDALEEKLRMLEVFEGREGKVRSLFGLGTRTLSAKEKGFIAKWFDEYGVSDELVALAYEKTVDATGKASIPY